MLINFGSNLKDIQQALEGTWSRSEDNGWVCIEMGNLKLYKKLCEKGNAILPELFMRNRNSITPYLKFTKSKAEGGIITLQEQYLTLSENSLILIIEILS